MGKNITEVVFIIDKSGSMHGRESDIEKSFSRFIEDQVRLARPCNITVFFFDTATEIILESESVFKLPSIDGIYNPGGMTALLDAVGFVVDRTGQRLASMSEEERPDKVIIVIATDGEENSSRRFTKGEILDKITHQRQQYNWDFLFIGANMDSFAEAGGIGIPATNTLSYKTDPAGIKYAYGCVSKSVFVSRETMNKASFNN